MASTDRPTVMNLANHAYFNLGGPLEAHELCIFATGYTPANDRQIPTGAIAGLSETTDEGDDLDFRDWRALRDQALDHNFVLLEGAKLREAASLRLVESNLQLDVLKYSACYSGLYGRWISVALCSTGWYLSGSSGVPRRTQPTCVSKHPSGAVSGQTYRQRTVYRFREIKEA